MFDMRDQRSRDLGEEPGEVYQTGIKPGAVTLTQHLPVQRKAKASAQVPPPPASETFGFVQAYGGDLQRKSDQAFPDQRPTPWMAAEQGTSGSAGQLPYLDRIQQSFGRHDVSSVRAYTDGNASAGASAMGAEAYAVGDQVAFGGAPTLHTAAHEAAHVVQQRAGVSLKGGVGQAGDPYERHADAVADKVVAGQSAESLLDEMAGSGGGGTRAIQRTHGQNGQQADGGAQQPGGQQQAQGGKQQAQGTLLGWMEDLTKEYVDSLKERDDALLAVLITRFEADWFKAKECLLFDKWPVKKPAPDRPAHDVCLSLMEELVKMRSRVCKKVADEAQKRVKGAVKSHSDDLPKNSPIAQSGMADAFKAEAENDKLTAKDHFEPMAPTGAEKKTSDIDVGSGGKNSEIGVRVFNETFREMIKVPWDPATLFDYNVYAADFIFPQNFVNEGSHTGPNKNKEGAPVETIATKTTVKSEHIVSKDAGLAGTADGADVDGAVAKARDQIQDESALLHIRRNCIDHEWTTYSQQRVKGAPPAERAALADTLKRVDLKFEAFLEEVHKMEGVILQEIDLAAKAAQSAWDDDAHLREALETRAKNAIYQERLMRVKTARLKYQTLKDKAQKTQADIFEMSVLATQVTEALTDAVFFANEVYSSEGATLHATQGIQKVQKAKKGFGIDIEVALTPAMYMQSFHENVGDSLHSIEHNQHDPEYAVYRAGKYIERMLLAGEQLAKTPLEKKALRDHASYPLLKKIGDHAAQVKDSADGDDPVKIKTHFKDWKAQSLPSVRIAVIALGADFPGQLQQAQAQGAQPEQQQPAQQQPAQQPPAQDAPAQHQAHVAAASRWDRFWASVKDRLNIK
jgi:hypothetical protein